MTDTCAQSAPTRLTAIADARSASSCNPVTIASGIKAEPLRATRSLRRRRAANDDPAPNPCLSCGACCAHFRVSFYCGEIAGEGGGTVPPELVTQVGPLRGCMKGTEDGGQRCVALRGELGENGIHCAIYEQRPSPCKEFPTWLADGTPNPDCQRLRKAIGLPLLAPRENEDDDDLDPTNRPPYEDDVAG